MFEPLYEAITYLERPEPSTPETVAGAVAAVDATLRSEAAEMEWDDAYDVLLLLSSRHLAAAPYLAAAAYHAGANTLHDRYAREFALKALLRTGADAAAVATITPLLHDKREELRNLAAKVIGKSPGVSTQKTLEALTGVVSDRRFWMAGRTSALIALVRLCGWRGALQRIRGVSPTKRSADSASQ
jgi:hypothetical protein